jgi:hypothetical protein
VDVRVRAVSPLSWLERSWTKLGISNVADSVCRAATCANRGEWRPARIHYLMAIRYAALIEIEMESPLRDTEDGVSAPESP